MIIIDSHCHLDYLEKDYILADLIKEAEQSNVKYMQTICTKISEFPKILAIANKYDNIFASVGVHPNNVASEDLVDANQIIKYCNDNKKVIGIGETGLDYYYQDTPRDLQIKSFLAHIEAARQTDLPVIIHSRNADDDMVEILTNEMKKGKFRALLHCFSSGRDLAINAVKLGVYISLAGIITFKNAEELRDIVKEIDINKILVETDSPYLAPVPMRGKVNQPSYTKHVVEYLAGLKNISTEECANITTNNFCNLFSKAHITT